MKIKQLAANIDFGRKDIFKNEVSVIKFGSKSCPPCNQLDSSFPSLMEKFNNVDFYIIDINENPEILTDAIERGLVQSFMSIPMTFIFKGGKMAGNPVSGFALQAIENEINKAINS